MVAIVKDQPVVAVTKPNLLEETEGKKAVKLNAEILFLRSNYKAEQNLIHSFLDIDSTNM